MFYCNILSSGSSLSKWDTFAEAERSSPTEKCYDRLVFVHSVKRYWNRLCEYIFRFGVSIMKMMAIMLCRLASHFWGRHGVWNASMLHGNVLFLKISENVILWLN